MRRAANVFCLVVLGFQSIGGRRASADIDHALTSAYANAGTSKESENQGLYLSTSEVSNSFNNPLYPTTVAVASGMSFAGFPIKGLGRLSASSSATAVDISATSGDGRATWQDYISINPTTGQATPGPIRMQAEAFGSVSSVNGGFYQIVADMTLSSALATKHIEPTIAPGPDGSPVAQGWDSLVLAQAGPGVFRYDGFFSIDVFPYDPAFGTLWKLDLDALSQAGSNGRLQVQVGAGANDDPDLPSGVLLRSVTLPGRGNVTPESLGYTVSFDSGMPSPNVTAVPEPSSLILAGIGSLSYLMYTWRKRQLRGVPAAS